MQVNISVRHGHLSDATRSKITAKVEKLARLFERLTAIEVTVDLEHEQTPTVDVRVSAEHKHDFVAAEQSSSLMGGARRRDPQARAATPQVQGKSSGSSSHGNRAPRDDP